MTPSLFVELLEMASLAAIAVALLLSMVAASLCGRWLRKRHERVPDGDTIASGSEDRRTTF